MRRNFVKRGISLTLELDAWLRNRYIETAIPISVQIREGIELLQKKVKAEKVVTSNNLQEVDNAQNQDV